MASRGFESLRLVKLASQNTVQMQKIPPYPEDTSGPKPLAKQLQLQDLSSPTEGLKTWNTTSFKLKMPAN